MYEYLASVQSAVRRVNDRIKTLARNFGSNSAVVNKITAQLDVLLPTNLYYRDGLPQISKPSDIFGDTEKMQAIQDLDENIKTWGAYRKQYEKEYEGYKKDFPPLKYKGVTVEQKGNIALPDFIQTMENLDKALREVSSDQLPSDALKIMQIKGRKNTYAELFEVTRILSEKGFI